MSGRARSRSPNPAAAATPKSAKSKSKSKSKKQLQKQNFPTNLTDNESIECVASVFGPIRTPLVSAVDKDIILDRLKKEVVNKFGFTLSNRRPPGEVRHAKQYLLGGKVMDDATTKSERKRKRQEAPTTQHDGDGGAEEEIKMSDIVRQRIIVGTNQCTRALEAASRGSGPAPSLVLLSRDLRPPTVLAHVPLLCRQTSTRVLVLPGQSSSELGRALGAKTVAVLLFLPNPLGGTAKDVTKNSVWDCHRCIDSFVGFACAKAPSLA